MSISALIDSRISSFTCFEESTLYQSVQSHICALSRSYPSDLYNLRHRDKAIRFRILVNLAISVILEHNFSLLQVGQINLFGLNLISFIELIACPTTFLVGNKHLLIDEPAMKRFVKCFFCFIDAFLLLDGRIVHTFLL